MKIKSIATLVASLTITACSQSALSNPTRLPVNPPLVAYGTLNSNQFFNETPTELKQDFWQLSQYFTTENGVTFCAPASIVTVLNALNITPSVAPAHYPYKLFNQDNLFYNNTILANNITPAKIEQAGLTLDQAAFILKQYAAHVTVYHASIIKSPQELKAILEPALASKNTYVIVNFDRQDAGEVGGGHFSPIAAYDPQSNRFLIMDVARYKYPPVWISADNLLSATQGIDSSSKLSRGFIIVSN